MAKSSGNAYLISDLINRGIDPLAFRYLCMTARYRTRINFTFASLKASENALNKLKIKFHEFRRSSHTNQIDTEKFNAWKMKFQNSFSDDLNMPEVLNLVWRLLESELNPKDKYELLIYIDQILGFDLPNTNDSFDIPDDILNICADRTNLRAQKQFKKSDDNFMTSIASINPCSPTEQFAHPLFATTPLIFFLDKLVLDAVTEGETTELLVNTPEHVVSGNSDHKIPKSNSSTSVFIPTFVPPAIKPLGVVTFPFSKISNIV